MWQAWRAGDRKAAVAAVPERVLNALILRGSPDAIRAGLRRYLAAGVDTAVLALGSSQPDPVKRREAMRTALRALAPTPE